MPSPLFVHFHARASRLRVLTKTTLALSLLAAAHGALAAPQPLKASKAQPLSLDAAMTVEQVFQAIAANCLEQVGGNQDGVTQGKGQGADVESLHQMRVGLRRLRSALKLFEAAAPCPPALQEDVSWLGKELGAAYMLAHGGVAPDFAIAAEGTDFGVNWSACGYAYYKITLEGTAVFTPLMFMGGVVVEKVPAAGE